jgi:hypothetical protein
MSYAIHAETISKLCKMNISEDMLRRFEMFCKNDIQRCLRNIKIHKCKDSGRHEYSLQEFAKEAQDITRRNFTYEAPPVSIVQLEEKVGGPYYLKDKFYYHPDHAVMNSDVNKMVVIHETVPGHHYMFSFMKEYDLPIDESHIAFIEGWGLYAESLSSPKDRCRYFLSRLIRVIRALADIAFHTGQEGRIEEIFRKYNSITRLDLEAEKQRILDRPGYNVCYVIGEQYFFKLRKMFLRKFPRKGIKTFHTYILGGGTLPFQTIEEHINSL